MADQQPVTQEDLRRAIARTRNPSGWTVAGILGGGILGIAITLGCLHAWDCLRFGGTLGQADAEGMMRVIEDQRKETNAKLREFRTELDAWEHWIERHVVGGKPIGAPPVGSP